VKDPSGAVIPDAKISILHLATGVATNTATNSDGYYATPPVNIGQYKIRVEKPGMKSWEGGVNLETGRVAVRHSNASSAFSPLRQMYLLPVWAYLAASALVEVAASVVKAVAWAGANSRRFALPLSPRAVFRDVLSANVIVPPV
jgi:hypothetical protein